jgi:hypothetical protein
MFLTPNSCRLSNNPGSKYSVTFLPSIHPETVKVSEVTPASIEMPVHRTFDKDPANSTLTPTYCPFQLADLLFTPHIPELSQT